MIEDHGHDVRHEREIATQVYSVLGTEARRQKLKVEDPSIDVLACILARENVDSV
jgi:hypothetical protein